MSRKFNWKVGVTLVLAVALMVTTSGLVIGSNLGFKINKNFIRGFTSGAGPKADNWISLPYNHPYASTSQLCTALGIAATAGSQIRKLNVQTGSFTSCAANGTNTQCCSVAAGAGCCCPPEPAFGCGVDPACTASAGGPHPACTDTGYTYGCNAGGPAPNQTNLGCVSSAGILGREVGGITSPVVLVGSSNETRALPVLRGSFVAANGPAADNWISVPYHTTWVNAQDVCNSIPGCSASTTCSVARLDASTGTFGLGAYFCGLLGGTNFTLVLGESIRLRDTSALGGNCGVCSGGTTVGASCGTGLPVCGGGGTCVSTTRDDCNLLPPHF